MRIAGLTILLCTIAACSRPDAVPPERAPVILIVIDTLRADTLGCYGGPAGVSDAIDAIAAQGIVFENVTAPCSWTRPSMGAMLTGRYPRSLGLYREIDESLPDDALQLGDHLQKNGYHTLGYTANPNINTRYGFARGFDVYHDSTVLFDWMPNAEDRAAGYVAPLHSAPQLFEAALRDLDAASEGPAYIQLNVMEVHEWHMTVNGLLREESGGRFLDEAYPTYAQTVWQVSKDIGAFLDTLRERPGWETAWIVITSDHGEGLGDHPDVADSERHGRTLYTSQTDVPLIISRLNGLREPARIAAPVRILDVAHTIAALVDAPMPPADGVSLLPMMNGDTLDLPDYFVTESAFRGHDKSGVAGPEWRYYIHRDDHEGTAPEELQRAGAAENGAATNQIASHPEIAGALSAYFNAWDAAHPRAAPTSAAQGLSPEELEQLETLGYVK